MAEFDFPGLGHARRELNSLARQPKPTTGLHVLKTAIIRELYPELRAARLAGHSWERINKALRASGLEPIVSTHYLGKTFRAIDKEYEESTGVKALPVDPQRGGKYKRRTQARGGALDPKGNNVSQEIIS